MHSKEMAALKTLHPIRRTNTADPLYAAHEANLLPQNSAAFQSSKTV